VDCQEVGGKVALFICENLCNQVLLCLSYLNRGSNFKGRVPMKETQSKRRDIVLFFLLLTVVFWACITTQVTRLNQNEYPPGDPSDVIVYLTPEDIKSEYEKIALIHMQGEGSWTNEQQMFEKAKQKAATLGANGIILAEVNEPSEGSKIAGAIFGTGTTRRGHVVAVYVYPDEYSNNFSNPPQSVPKEKDSSGLHHVVLPPRDGTKLERTGQFESTPSKAQDSVQQETISPDVSKVSIEERIDQQRETPSTKLFYFRKVVESATKFTDDQLLKFYRKKYPALKSKSDSELIRLIEKKYKEIFEKKN